MNYSELILETFSNLTSDLFDEVKNTVVDELIHFSVLKKDEISPVILSEKVCDYIEKVQLSTGKAFEQQVEEYISKLDAIVGNRITKPVKADKEKGEGKMPRARKYYDRACVLKKSCTTKQGLIDYSRIMMCLYMAILANNFGLITDFNFSIDCLNLFEIMNAMRNEKTDLFVGIGKKNRFDTKDEYGIDRCTFVLIVLMYYCIKSKEVVGEY